MLEKGIGVRALVRSLQDRQTWISHLPIDFIDGDLLHPATFESAVREVDLIIHIAGVTKAKHRRSYYEGNVLATKNLFEAARKSNRLGKLCYISSLTAAGPSPDGTPLDEEFPAHPITAYGKSKLEAELVCQSYGTSVPYVILRPPTVYGPRDKDFLQLFKAARFGIQPNIGSSRKTLSVIFGPDLAEAIVTATLSNTTTGQTYFVSDPSIYEQVHLFEQLASLVDSKPLRIDLPPFLLYAAAVFAQSFSYFTPQPATLNIEKARDLLQQHWVCTPKKLERDTSYSAKTSAEEGLAITYQWYKEKGWL